MADFAARFEMDARSDLADGRDAARRAVAFESAARHSARVRVLRIAILGGTLSLVAILVGIALFDPFGRLAGGFSIGGIGVDGTKVTMAHPRLAGFRKDGRPYLVNADEAVQDALHPTLVELHRIDSDITLSEGGDAHLIADNGYYDSAKEHMDVQSHVRVTSPQYDARLRSASIDFNGGRYESKEPVTIVMSNGTTIAGDSLLATGNGKELAIEGHVKTMIPPAPASDEPQSPSRSARP
jgi:lipopolysaccharide export system protein LptC